MRTLHARGGVVALLTSVVLVLAACGTSTTATPPAAGSAAGSTAHAAPDVAFARNMIPHHRQAVVLAAMVPSHSANAELRVMATQIGADQQAEIRTLQGLLTEWGEPVDTGPSTPMDQGGMPMAGMVDQGTMKRLQTLDDDSFDTLWVTSMIGHHQGAIQMAQDEIAHGQSADAIHVATLIVAAQQREIAMMTHLISASR